MPRELVLTPPLPEENERTMWLLICNMASTLAPEPWVAVQQKLGIEEFKITTADECDYGKLMKARAKSLREHGVRLQEIFKIIEGLSPLPGAKDFVEWLKPVLPRAFIVTDGFEEYALPIFDKL